MMLYAEKRGQGTPIIFLHGFTLDHRMLLPLDAIFENVPHPWSRYYLDLPGSGNSARLSHMSGASVRSAVSDFIETEIGSANFALIGISFGGYLARAIHTRFGDQVLGTALLAPAVKVLGNRVVYAGGPLESDKFDMELSADDQVLYDSFQTISPFHTRTAWDSYVRHIIPGFLSHDRDAFTELLENYNPEPFPESGLEPLGGKNIIIAGKQDKIVGWKDQIELAQYYLHQSFFALDGAGHNVHLDQPEIVHLLLLNWLSHLSSSAHIAMKNP